jgi:hypothetical protein
MSISDQEEQHLEEAAAHPFWQVPVRAAQWMTSQGRCKPTRAATPFSSSTTIRRSSCNTVEMYKTREAGGASR